MVQTAKEALDECIKLDPTRSWITTEKEQYTVHTDPPQAPTFTTLYSAWCCHPNRIDDGERFESFSWESVLDKVRNSICAGMNQQSPVAP